MTTQTKGAVAHANGEGVTEVGTEANVTPSREVTAWDKLRAPFPPEKIGRLPKAGVELSFVGHADVTDRLLAVDPTWNWEPLALDADGLPLFVVSDAGRPVGLWIKLTVNGVTRLGFGSVSPGAFDPEKQLIGDGLRNAAMRFGVALDLWRKEEHPAEDAAPANGTAPRAATAAPQGDGKGGRSTCIECKSADPAILSKKGYAAVFWDDRDQCDGVVGTDASGRTIYANHRKVATQPVLSGVGAAVSAAADQQTFADGTPLPDEVPF